MEIEIRVTPEQPFLLNGRMVRPYRTITLRSTHGQQRDLWMLGHTDRVGMPVLARQGEEGKWFEAAWWRDTHVEGDLAELADAVKEVLFSYGAAGRAYDTRATGEGWAIGDDVQRETGGGRPGSDAADGDVPE